jgi:F0F1-type ATP synthase membrane subunit c/vacuolar-type H+-ATPase subunit K
VPMADPTPSTFLQTLRVLCAALMASMVIILLAVSFVLAGKDSTGSFPVVALIALVVVAVGDVFLIPAVGYRLRPIAPGTPEDEARRSSAGQLQQTTVVRFALAEAVGFVGLALSLIVDADGFVLIFAGVVVAEVLMVVHVWPSDRLISKVNDVLESEGGRSYLREALDAPPPARRG